MPTPSVPVRYYDLLPEGVKLRDTQNGLHLEKFLSLFNDSLDSLKYDIDTLIGTVDVDTCPAELLPYLGVMVGLDDIEFYEGMSELDRREQIRWAVRVWKNKGSLAGILYLCRIMLGLPTVVKPFKDNLLKTWSADQLNRYPLMTGVSVDTGTDIITVNSTASIADGDKIVFDPKAGILPTGINAFEEYTVDSLSGNTFKILDSTPATVNITGVGSVGWTAQKLGYTHPITWAVGTDVLDRATPNSIGFYTYGDYYGAGHLGLWVEISSEAGLNEAFVKFLKLQDRISRYVSITTTPKFFFDTSKFAYSEDLTLPDEFDILIEAEFAVEEVIYDFDTAGSGLTDVGIITALGDFAEDTITIAAAEVLPSELIIHNEREINEYKLFAGTEWQVTGIMEFADSTPDETRVI